MESGTVKSLYCDSCQMKHIGKLEHIFRLTDISLHLTGQINENEGSYTCKKILSVVIKIKGNTGPILR